MALTVTIVTVLFAGVHVWQYRNNIAVIAVITLLSLSLTLVRAVSRRLLPCFLIHLIFNGIQSAVLVAEPFLEKAHKAPTTVPSFHLIVDALRHLL